MGEADVPAPASSCSTPLSARSTIACRAGMEVEPGSIVVAPLGPRQLVGAVWEPERLPAEEVGDNRLRPLVHAYDLPPLAAPLAPADRMDRRLLSRAAGRGAAHGPALLGRAGGRALDHRISRHRPCPRAADAAARAGAGADRRAAGAGPRAGDHRRRLRRGDPRPRQGRRDRGGRGRDRRPLPRARPGPRSARARAGAGGGGGRAARRGRRGRVRALCCSTGSPARARPRSISRRSPRRSGAGRQALVLLPEIALTEPFLKRFAARFGCEPVAWHSGLRQSQRRRAWRAIAIGEARVVVGARSALFLPYPKLGLIVVDEAHEASFKQEEGVQYHARDVAVMRGQFEQVPVDPRLGHAGDREPAHGRDRHLQGAAAARPLWRRAPARHGGARHARRTRRRAAAGWRPSWSARSRRISRRASRACSSSTAAATPRSRSAAIAATASNAPIAPPGWSSTASPAGSPATIAAMSCRRRAPAPNARRRTAWSPAAPASSGSPTRSRDLLPEARTIIVTSDTIWSPAKAAEFVARMEAGEIDIVIGTQLVTKGYHFPNLTLVGVVDADLGLAGGDLRAAERSFQQIRQVSGRAGRGDKPGRVLVQTHDPSARGDPGAGRAATPRASTPPRPTPGARRRCRRSAGSPRSSSPRRTRPRRPAAARADRPRRAAATTIWRCSAPPPPRSPCCAAATASACSSTPPAPCRCRTSSATGSAGSSWPRGVRVSVDVDPYSFL